MKRNWRAPCWVGGNRSYLLPLYLCHAIIVVFVSSRPHTRTTTRPWTGRLGGSRDCIRAVWEMSERVYAHVWWVVSYDLATIVFFEHFKQQLENTQTLYFLVSHDVDMEHIQVYSSSWLSLGTGNWVCVIIEINELTTWHVTIPWNPKIIGKFCYLRCVV